MLNVTGHQEDTTQNCSGTTSYSWDGCYQTNRAHHVLVRTWRPWDLWAPWEEAEHADAMDNSVEAPQRLNRTSRGSCNPTSGRTLRNRKRRPEELFVQLGSQQMREEAAPVPDDGERINQVCCTHTRAFRALQQGPRRPRGGEV